MERLSPQDPRVTAAIDELVKGGRVIQLHFMGLMYGATLFRDRRTGRLCLQENASVTCYEGFNDELRRRLENAVSRASAVIVFRISG